MLSFLAIAFASMSGDGGSPKICEEKEYFHWEQGHVEEVLCYSSRGQQCTSMGKCASHLVSLESLAHERITTYYCCLLIA